MCLLGNHPSTTQCTAAPLWHGFDVIPELRAASVWASHLYLPSSEQRLIQSHGCPNRLFVCKLNVGKPEKNVCVPQYWLNAEAEWFLLPYLLSTYIMTTRGATHVVLKQCDIKPTLTLWDAPCICHIKWWLCLLNRSRGSEPPALPPWHRSPPEGREDTWNAGKPNAASAQEPLQRDSTTFMILFNPQNTDYPLRDILPVSLICPASNVLLTKSFPLCGLFAVILWVHFKRKGKLLSGGPGFARLDRSSSRRARVSHLPQWSGISQETNSGRIEQLRC